MFYCYVGLPECNPFPIAFLDFQVGRNLNQEVNNIHFHQHQEEHLEHSGIVFSRVFPNLSVHRSHDYNSIKHQALFLVLVHILLPLLTDFFHRTHPKNKPKFHHLSVCPIAKLLREPSSLEKSPLCPTKGGFVKKQ